MPGEAQIFEPQLVTPTSNIIFILSVLILVGDCLVICVGHMAPKAYKAYKKAKSRGPNKKSGLGCPQISSISIFDCNLDF